MVNPWFCHAINFVPNSDRKGSCLANQERPPQILIHFWLMAEAHFLSAGMAFPCHPCTMWDKFRRGVLVTQIPFGFTQQRTKKTQKNNSIDFVAFVIMKYYRGAYRYPERWIPWHSSPRASNNFPVTQRNCYIRDMDLADSSYRIGRTRLLAHLGTSLYDKMST